MTIVSPSPNQSEVDSQKIRTRHLKKKKETKIGDNEPSFTAQSNKTHPLPTDILNTMKTFQIVTLFALIAAAMAFAPNSVPQGELLL